MSKKQDTAKIFSQEKEIISNEQKIYVYDEVYQKNI